jgi:hypothetical protein
LSSSIVDDNVDECFSMTQQRKGFYAQGRHWIFYRRFGGASLVFKTSTDGITWSTLSTVPCTGDLLSGDNSSVWLQDPYVHIAIGLATNFPRKGHLKYIRGLLKPDGTITWGPEQIVVDLEESHYVFYPVICTDASGHPWIGFKDVSTILYQFKDYMVRSNRNDGIWQTTTDFPCLIRSNEGYASEFLVLPIASPSSIKVYILSWNYNTGSQMWGRFWDGSWSTTENIEVDCTHVSGVTIGDEIHITYVKYLELPCKQYYRTRTTSWSSEEIISTVHYGTISKLGSDLYVCGYEVSLPFKDVYKVVKHVTWGSPIFLFEDSPYPAVGPLNSHYEGVLGCDFTINNPTTGACLKHFNV